MRRLLMLVHELKLNKGGMTTAMFNRSKQFNDQEIEADFVTFDYNPNYKSIINKLKKSGKMDNRTNMYNVFEHFDQRSIKTEQIVEENSEEFFKNKWFDSLTEVTLNNEVSRMFDKVSGEYLYYLRKNKDDIVFIDVFENGVRTKRINFVDKKVKYIELFDQSNNKIAEVLFNRIAQPFAYRKINSNGVVTDIHLLNENKSFKNNVELSRYFLNLISDKQTVLLCDGPGSFSKMINVDNVYKKYAVIHANHHENWGLENEFKKSEENIFRNSKEIDGIITLTEAQANDIKREFGINNIYTISNFINIGKQHAKVKKDKFIIGTISRFTKEKGFDRMLDVAEQVCKKNKNIQFHLYGSGSYFKHVEKEIKNRKLDSFVILKGYTNQAKKTLNEFDMYISASHYEGQGLSILEAMEQSVPVVAFDIKYGPKDIITNNINGLLVKDNDTKKMTKEILKYSKKPKMIEKMGKNARETILSNFNESKILKDWMKVIE